MSHSHSHRSDWVGAETSVWIWRTVWDEQCFCLQLRLNRRELLFAVSRPSGRKIKAGGKNWGTGSTDAFWFHVCWPSNLTPTGACNVDHHLHNTAQNLPASAEHNTAEVQRLNQSRRGCEVLEWSSSATPRIQQCQVIIDMLCSDDESRPDSLFIVCNGHRCFFCEVFIKTCLKVQQLYKQLSK